ncbi:amidohydrolase family protein [Arenibacter sp. BSSL-BM3]|uniref:Amidohydrolase family protein n=1 Tax=Arenibacter arenosicollis TaxID=2762274 RepID=A0ABR7QLH1_9FLAO|nr:amidohydrolase family protein [Arenibacter arenosicollis]MBC8768041.1 amidohydrolase family protein [Arenibacter arenosicollis]
MRIRFFVLVTFLCGVSLSAQDYFPKNDGVKAENNNYTAFINAKIFITPTKILDKGTLLIKKGKVVLAGKTVTVPKNSVIIDLQGKFIYPSFIDIYSDFGVNKPNKAPSGGRSAQYEPSREGFYWNDHIMPENNAISKFKYDNKKAKELREAGFGTVNTHIQDGIARGSGALVTLNDTGNDSDRILADKSAQYFSLTKSVAKRQAYPSSLMGTLALLRQMYFDADWYAHGNIATKDLSLEALNANKGLVQIFEAKDKDNVLRADKIGDKFNINYTILAGGNEFENVAGIEATNATLIVPINFPDPYDVSDPYLAEYISLEDMRFWNQAPTNPKVLEENNITFGLTLHDQKSTSSFRNNLLKAIDHGLSKTKALEALTTVPAQILGKSNLIGSLQNGSQANFLISSGDIFDKETVLYENWVQGQQHIINNKELKDIRGNYNLAAGNKTYQLSITGELDKPKAELKEGVQKLTSKINYEDNWVTLSFNNKEGNMVFRLTGMTTSNSDNISGKVLLPDGSESTFNATRTTAFIGKEKDGVNEKPIVVPITFPNIGYGYSDQPKQESILFKNATVWTSEEAGILEHTDVLVKNGKIAKIGKDLKGGGATIVDCKGKHLTAGIIDEHTHIAALAINESGQNSSAEVKMEDVVNPEHIGIYRDLAGGVTSAQLLHGSANPIGGQSAILKLKWGASADGMIYDNSPKFIKFALGENVKQSNWNSYSRFPQTRMGVEQTFINYFQRAKEYDIKKKSGQPFRFDEEMETLAEIINGERFISCHSYVQSEINMLMKVAEKFNFKVNTFTHILEGYKVADKMVEHGVGASTFSDWWAYKYEVNDAIPYNAAIMQSQGITVAINSDDAEMSRRLNQEAAKTVKYGGMTELEAWKMVTINPAKLLHIDDRVGSIKEGKDADIVLWSNNPLSVYAKAEKTMIDGAVYFDLEKDKQQREAIKKEKALLINLMLKEKDKGSPTQEPKKKNQEQLHCDSL